MIIRSFMDESVSAALKQVRSEMGGDAVVIKTNRVKANDVCFHYEVTACLDNPTAAQASMSLPDNSRETINNPRVDLMTDKGEVHRQLVSLEAKMEQLLLLQKGEQIVDNKILRVALESMKNSDLPVSFISDFENLFNRKNGNVAEAQTVIDLLASQLEPFIDPLSEFKIGDRILIMGAPASGKTSILGKLAARLVMKDKLPVMIHSINSSKVGAIDELESYAELLNINVSSSATALKLEGDSDKVLLVDCGNIPYGNGADMEELITIKKVVEDFQATHRLAVFSALTRTTDIYNQAEKLRELSPTHVAFTMTDLTDNWGGIIAATQSVSAGLSMMTEAPSGTGQLVEPKAELISRKILSRVNDNE